MAQSFNAISTSLGEAERQKNGRPWTKIDYQNHQGRGYRIDNNCSYLNTTFVSANGKNERDLVNTFLEHRMLELNAAKEQKVATWNQEHVNVKDNHGRLLVNSKGKPYRKRSVDKRELFAVGKWQGKGTRSLPYDTFKGLIEKGNARGKEPDKRYRTNVLQQFVIGFGNDNEWKSDRAHRFILDGIQGVSDDLSPQDATEMLNQGLVKPWLARWQKENPSMHIVQAVVHYDETHPHLQITVLPWVDGKENGGLGSTSYTGAIKHDHPHLTGNIVNEWYRQEHNELRHLIDQADLQIVDGNQNIVTMNLNTERPGSHKSHRIDYHQRFQAELNKQQHYLHDLADHFDQSKPSSIKLIKQLAPNNTVPADMLPKGAKPAKISTTIGEYQHQSAPSVWLLTTAIDLLLRALNRIKHLMIDIKDKEQALKKREDQLTENEARVDAKLASFDVSIQDAYDSGREAAFAEDITATTQLPEHRYNLTGELTKTKEPSSKHSYPDNDLEL